MQSSNIFYLFFLKINPYINVYYIKFIKKNPYSQILRFLKNSPWNFKFSYIFRWSPLNMNEEKWKQSQEVEEEKWKQSQEIELPWRFIFEQCVDLKTHYDFVCPLLKLSITRYLGVYYFYKQTSSTSYTKQFHNISSETLIFVLAIFFSKRCMTLLMENHYWF